MKVAIGSDHAGFWLKKHLLKQLHFSNVHWIDVGAKDDQPSDYPVYAKNVATLLQSGDAQRGIVLCGSGVGASIVANKYRGIRCAICHDTYSARQGVEHDDMNILALGARVIGTALAEELVSAFLHARYTKQEKYQRRNEQLLQIELDNLK